jgi:hypothetical protein
MGRAQRISDARQNTALRCPLAFMFSLCSYHPMSHVMPIGLPREARATHRIPADLRIPQAPFRVRITPRRTESWWREAMRWSLIGLTTSWVAGEVTLLLLGF